MCPLSLIGFIIAFIACAHIALTIDKSEQKGVIYTFDGIEREILNKVNFPE
ncbi:conserved hypothetical protein [Bacillus cereus Q1]|uniref:Uncharacterized protein n=1 Tax=Bacillus cereus (strain Q1) TaxID=361100 RepID=B9ISE9_BACCQ|nr:conserved hypothetical protein [Bacillus cereus Q1]BCC16182.1 hypothetical protein BCM0075_0952 [Bacillus cereus]